MNNKNEDGLFDEKRRSKRIIIRDEAAVLRIASGYKQAVLKVVSYGRGKASIARQLKYISRDGELNIELHDGTTLESLKEQKNLVSEWYDLYSSTRKNARNTAHFILSSPPGTNRNTFNLIAREYLQEQFGNNHEYAFVQHDDTDHPHVHVILCLQGYRGNKLDIRKKELREWREDFAKKCREYGVMLDASRRFERGFPGKSSKSAMVQMRKKRKITPTKDIELINRVNCELQNKKSHANTGEDIREKRHKDLKRAYLETAKKLLVKDNEKTVIASSIIKKFSNNLERQKTRDERIKSELMERKQKRNIPLERELD